jgi:hypothetical protein
VQVTDSLVMAGPFAHLSTPGLRKLVEDAEAAHKAGPDPVAACETHLVGFSTALTDAERRYLELCAELYARDGYGTGRPVCPGEQQCPGETAQL